MFSPRHVILLQPAKWDKTTSGFGKRTAAIWDFRFRFLFLPNFRHRRVILHWPTKFCKIEQPSAELWRHIAFPGWWPAAILDLIWTTLDHPWSAIVGLRLVVNLVLIGFIVLEILGFLYLPFWLEIAFSRPFWRFWGIFSQMTSHIVLTYKRHFLAWKHVVSHEASKSVQRFDLGAFPRKKGQDRTGQDRTGQSKKVTKW